MQNALRFIFLYGGDGGDGRTKREPLPDICDFSRGGLNVRLLGSHPNLAPRPQISGSGSHLVLVVPILQILKAIKKCIVDVF